MQAYIHIGAPDSHFSKRMELDITYTDLFKREGTDF
jgi:hypothetical protein